MMAGGESRRDGEDDGATCRVAVIDLGTVTCRLLVADVGPAGIVPVSRSYDVCQMGEGVASTGRISGAALERVEQAVSAYRAAIDGLASSGAPVRRTAVLATSAARDAENSDELVALLERHGFALDVIPGQVEARLSFAGAISPVAASASGDAAFVGDVLTSDVGGGSTELVAGDVSAGGEPVIRVAQSLDVGARRATDLFLASDPPAPDEIRRASAWARETITPFFEGLGCVPSRLVAAAGTVTTLVCVRDGIAPYDDARVMGARVTLDDLDRLVERLAVLPVESRAQLPGLDAKRAGVIVGGAIVQREVLALAGLSHLTVSTTGLLEGTALWLGRSLTSRPDGGGRPVGDGLPWALRHGRTT